MSDKILEDAKASGFEIIGSQVISDSFHTNITEKLTKFAELVQANNVEADSQLVPIEPTREMARAFHNRIANAVFQQAYKDMLEAAPVMKESKHERKY